MLEVINDFLPGKGLVTVNLTSVSLCVIDTQVSSEYFCLLPAWQPSHARCMYQREPLKDNALAVSSSLNRVDPRRLRVLIHNAYDPRTTQRCALSNAISRNHQLSTS